MPQISAPGYYVYCNIDVLYSSYLLLCIWHVYLSILIVILYN